MNLLLHICCANCAVHPVRELLSRGNVIRGMWYNPNIQPREEYARRLEALGRLEALWGLDIAYRDHGQGEFDAALSGHQGIRCEACYGLRLKEAALAAKEMGLEGFTTTLLVSPHQKFDMIVDIGRQTQKDYGVPFYFEDFRGGYRAALKVSRELGLYRQKYCGCLHSKREREEAALSASSARGA